MFNLKIAALVGSSLLFSLMTGSIAEAATIKKRAGVTYKCVIENSYERCVVLKKKKIKRKKVYRQRTNNTVAPTQAEWPISFDTSNIYDNAYKFIGLHERSDRVLLSATIKIDPARIPWCAAFLNSILDKSGFSGTGSNHARSFLRYGENTHTPRKGDIVVLRKHVGVYAGIINKNGRKYVAVLGGNQQNQVKISYFLETQVLSYRRVT